MGAKRAYRRAQAQTCWDLPTLTRLLQKWRRRIFEQNSHRRWNMGPSLWARIQKAKYGVETPRIASEEEIQDSTFCGKGERLFWDSKGPILEDYLEKGRTINSARYSDMLANNLKPAVHTKRQGLLSKKVLLLHDNARPHTASHTVETINHLGFEVLNTLPTAQISPLPTTISLDHSKMHYEVNFLWTKMCGKRCINGCATNRKPSQACGPLDQVHRKGRRLCRKMTYLFRPTFV